MIPLGLNDSLLLTSLQKGIILLLMSNPVVAQSLLHICFISFKLSPFEFLSFQVGDSYSLKKSKLQQKKFEISRSQQLNHSKPQQKTTNNHSAPYKAYLAPTKRSLENKSYWNSSRKPIWKVDVQYIYIYIIIKKFTTHIRWFQKNREKSPKTPRPATLMIWSPNLGIMSVQTSLFNIIVWMLTLAHFQDWIGTL